MDDHGSRVDCAVKEYIKLTADMIMSIYNKRLLLTETYSGSLIKTFTRRLISGSR